MALSPEQTGMDEIRDNLRRIEERISRLEAHLGLEADEAEGSQAPGLTEADAEEKLELQLGQNWFAKVGIVVLALGIMFLLTFPYQSLPPALPTLFGYCLVGCLITLSHYWRDSFQQISRYLMGGGLLLLFFATLRLSYFGQEPAIASTLLELVLLLAVVSINLTIAWRRQSVYLAGMSMLCGFTAALLAREDYLIFPIVLALSVATVLMWRRFHWTGIMALGIASANITHALWAVNNPIVGNPLQLLSAPEFNLVFVLAYALVFAAGCLSRTTEQTESSAEITLAFVNGAGSYALFLLLTLVSFTAHTVTWQVGASLLYLTLAILFWVRKKSRYGTFAYAMLGYTALSVAIIAQFKIPDAFIWLCCQSIIVISTAVWFRSRFIVVGNFGIFVLVFTGYLVSAKTLGPLSISFGVVALLSARILNWQRDRLELRTELMRNAYLACALIVIPYALFHTVPSGYVSLSWLVVALLYYAFSRLLKNRKYRWMALLTTSITILYVLFVDLVGVNATLRIVSFLVLGSALLLISMLYTRRRLRGGSGQTGAGKGARPSPGADGKG